MSTVVTLTLNPTVDETTHVERMIPNSKLRCAPPMRQPGGGGINVARMASRLGQPVRALWTQGGPHGQELERLLEAEAVPHEPIPIAEATRRNVTIQVGQADELYRLVYPGPSLSGAEEQVILERVAGLGRPAYFVASGSLPADGAPAFYGEILRSVPPGVPVAVDTSGPSLLAAATAGATLIKPNLRELSQLVGRRLRGLDAIRQAAEEVLRDFPVQIVVVSLADRGALYSTGKEWGHVESPPVRALSAVGAGDSAVAGIVVGLCRGLSLAEAVRLGMACGAAAVSTPGTKLASLDSIVSLYGSLPVTA